MVRECEDKQKEKCIRKRSGEILGGASPSIGGNEIFPITEKKVDYSLSYTACEYKMLY